MSYSLAPSPSKASLPIHNPAQFDSPGEGTFPRNVTDTPMVSDLTPTRKLSTPYSPADQQSSPLSPSPAPKGPNSTGLSREVMTNWVAKPRKVLKGGMRSVRDVFNSPMINRFQRTPREPSGEMTDSGEDTIILKRTGAEAMIGQTGLGISFLEGTEESAGRATSVGDTFNKKAVKPRKTKVLGVAGDESVKGVDGATDDEGAETCEGAPAKKKARNSRRPSQPS